MSIVISTTPWESMDDLNYVSTHWHRRKKGFLKNLIIKYECSSQSKHLSLALFPSPRKKIHAEYTKLTTTAQYIYTLAGDVWKNVEYFYSLRLTVP